MKSAPKVVRWGLVGCGDIARKRVAPALRDLPNCRLLAVARADYSRAEAFAREFGAEKWYRNWEEINDDPQIDAVYLATPVDLHAPMTIRAAEQGKHVLCEKPMALSVEECDRMLEACRSNGVLLGVAYYRHFYPAIRRIKELLDQGEIGTPVVAQINAFEYFDPAPGDSRHWFVQPSRAGGGPMFDFGCHRIEVLTHLFGEVTDARGIAGLARFERRVEDTATALLRFKSGVQASVSVTHAAWEPQDTLDLFCTEGSIHVPVLNQGKLQVVDSSEQRLEELPPHGNFHQPLIEDFSSAVLDGREPLVDGRIGREINGLLARVYADSIQRGRSRDALEPGT